MKKGKQSGWWGCGEGSVASAPMLEFYHHTMSMWIVSHMVCHHPLFSYLTLCTTLWIYIILIIQSLHAGNSRVNLGTKFLMFAPRIHVWLRFLLFGGVQTWEWISPFPHLHHHNCKRVGWKYDTWVVSMVGSFPTLKSLHSSLYARAAASYPTPDIALSCINISFHFHVITKVKNRISIIEN